MKNRTRVIAALALSLFALPALADGWKDESRHRGWHGDGHGYGHYRKREREHARHDRRIFREGYREGYRDGYRDGDRHDDRRYYAPRRVVHRYTETRHHGHSDNLFGIDKLVIVLD